LKKAARTRFQRVQKEKANAPETRVEKRRKEIKAK
jgi:hypothetical protein